MRCDRCGQQVPDDANFCPACGAPVAPPAATADETTSHGDAIRTGTEATTSGIPVGEFDPEHEVEELPEVAPGTGMLVVVRGPNAGSRFLLDREQTSVGRHPDADIFLDDVTVSRRHAKLTLTEHGILLQDNGSLNGTYVNGDRVDERQLATSDELQIGRFKLLFVGEAGSALGSPS